MNALWEALAVTLALATALWLRPWRMLRGGKLLTPLCATLVLLPWLWALPRLHTMPLQLHLSLACLVTLMLGWPLAVLALAAVALISGWIAPAPLATLLADALWLGLMPATLALLWGAALRRCTGHHIFIYILGRGFLGTVLCVFASGLLAQWAGDQTPFVGAQLARIARWLMAWGDGVLTGMLCAVFVAFRPQWLATWSDALYLRKEHEG